MIRRTHVLSHLAFFLVIALCSACTSWDAHAYTALGIHRASDGVRAGILSARGSALRQAGLQVQLTGGSDAEIATAIDEAASEFDSENSTLIETQGILATSSNAYSTEVFAAMRGQSSNPESVIRRLGQAALSAYQRLQRILADNHIVELPELPDGTIEFLGALLGGDEGASTGSDAEADDDGE